MQTTLKIPKDMHRQHFSTNASRYRNFRHNIETRSDQCTTETLTTSDDTRLPHNLHKCVVSRTIYSDSNFKNRSILVPRYNYARPHSILLSIILFILSTLIFSTNAYADCIDETAQELRIDGDLLRAIAWRESHFRPNAQHRNRNGSIDIGLMQVNSIHLPKLRQIGVSRSMLSNSCTNVRAAGWLLAQIFQNYGSTWRAIGEYHSHTPGLSNQYAKQIHEIYLARSWSRRAAALTGPERSWHSAPFGRMQSIQEIRPQRVTRKLDGVQVINVSYEGNIGDVSSRRSNRRFISSLYGNNVNHLTHIWRRTPELSANSARITKHNKYNPIGRMYSRRNSVHGKATYIANVRVRPAWVPYAECSTPLGHRRALDEIVPQSALAWTGVQRDLVAGAGRMADRRSPAPVASINAKRTPHQPPVIDAGDKRNLTMRKAPSSPLLSIDGTGDIYRNLFANTFSTNENQFISRIFLNDTQRNWTRVIDGMERHDLTSTSSRQSVKLLEISGTAHPANVEQFRNVNSAGYPQEHIRQCTEKELDDTRRNRWISTDNGGVGSPKFINYRLDMPIKLRCCLWKPSTGSPLRSEISNVKLDVFAPTPHPPSNFTELQSKTSAGSTCTDEYPCPAEGRNLLTRGATITRFCFGNNFSISRIKLIAFQHGPPQCETAWSTYVLRRLISRDWRNCATA